MANHYIVTHVLGSTILCVPERVFNAHFTVIDGYCRHRWYYSEEYMENVSLQETWNKFLETYRIDSKKSQFAFGNALNKITILCFYQWLE